MNKHLSGLAERAGFRFIADDGIGWSGNHNSSLEAFAKLIIAECLSQSASSIKEHFGVEYESK